MTPSTNRGSENTIEYPVIVDWLTISGHFLCFQEMIEFLGLKDSALEFESSGAYWFFKYSMTYNNEITLMLCQKGDYTKACINLSGKGCRDIESFSDYSLFDIICKVNELDGFSCSRIDLAMDILDDSFSIDTLTRAYEKGNFTCRSKFTNIMKSNNDGIKGTSLYFGRQSSHIYINIYDKRAERGYNPDDMPNWTRIEIRCRDENAYGVVQKLSDNIDVGIVFCGVLNNYLRFVVNSSDSNKSRVRTAPYWSKLISYCEKIKVISSMGVEYDYSKFENSLFQRAGSSLLTYLKCHTVDDLLNELIDRGIKMNPKQKMLVDNYVKGIDYMYILD